MTALNGCQQLILIEVCSSLHQIYNLSAYLAFVASVSNRGVFDKTWSKSKEMEDPFIPNQSQLSRQTCAETFAMQATP